jgi:hypothetical protein
VTQPVRFLFDECISRPAVERQIRDSLQLYGGDAEVAHLFDKFPPASPDKEWIPSIAKEGGWIIISADRGTHSRKDERLPNICRELGVTHVLLSASLHRRNMYFKALAISSCWHDLIEAADSPPGTGFSLIMRETKSGHVFRLQKKTSAIADEDIPNIQKRLL